MASLRPADAPPLGSFSLSRKSPVAGAGVVWAAVGVVVEVSVPLIAVLAARSLAAASLPTPPYPEAASVEAAGAPPPIPSHFPTPTLAAPYHGPQPPLAASRSA